MKTLQQCILEYNSPDNIYINNCEKISYDSEGAYPFIINIENKMVIFGDEMDTHINMLKNMSDSEFKLLCLSKDIEFDAIRYVNPWGGEDETVSDDGKTLYHIWKITRKKRHPELFDKNDDPKFLTGRIWNLPQAIGETDIDNYPQYNAIIISWWGEMKPKNYVKLSTYIIQNAIDQKVINNVISPQQCNWYGIDNNGEMVDLKKTQKIKKQSKEAKVKQQIAQAIHLANQKEKDDYYKEFKKHRDEKNQTELYNHTKSKTEAEYRSIKYQESLEYESN